MSTGTGRYHWSNCAAPARFFKIDAVASLPWLALILHPTWTTTYAAVGVTLILIYIEIIRKMTVVAFIRSLNIQLTGRIKATVNLIKELAQQ